MTARPDVFHVSLTARDGSKVKGVYQFHEREDAESFATSMCTTTGYTAEITPGPLVTEFVEARTLRESDRLANGSVMLSRVFYGLQIRASGVRTIAPVKSVYRSYNPDQLVEIEAR